MRPDQLSWRHGGRRDAGSDAMATHCPAAPPNRWAPAVAASTWHHAATAPAFGVALAAAVPPAPRRGCPAPGSSRRVGSRRANHGRRAPGPSATPQAGRDRSQSPSCQPLARSRCICPHQSSLQGLSARKASPASSQQGLLDLGGAAAGQGRQSWCRKPLPRHQSAHSPGAIGLPQQRQCRDGGRGCGESPLGLAPDSGWLGGDSRWVRPSRVAWAAKRSLPPACGPSPLPDPQLRCRP
jgi:hypothetical protein